MFSLISISKSGEFKNRIGSAILIRPIDYAESPCSTGKETVSRIILIEVISKSIIQRPMTTDNCKQHIPAFHLRGGYVY